MSRRRETELSHWALLANLSWLLKSGAPVWHKRGVNGAFLKIFHMGSEIGPHLEVLRIPQETPCGARDRTQMGHMLGLPVVLSSL